MTTFEERRRFERLQFQCGIMYRIKDSDQILMGSIQNLSGGGVCLTTQDEISVGDTIHIEFSLPGTPFSVYARATAVWASVSRQPYGSTIYITGLSFDKIGENQREEVIKFVTRRLKSLRIRDEDGNSTESPATDNRNAILVVDDDPDILDALKTILDNEYDVITAADGYSAIEKAKSQKPSLIFLDIMMPGIDGFSTLLMLKNDDDTKSVPVIMLSVLNEREKISLAAREGAASYIVKPFDPDFLLSKVSQFLHK